MFMRLDPWSMLARMEEDLGVARRRLPSASSKRSDLGTEMFKPSAQVTTEGEDVILAFDLPGIDVENDVTITLEQGYLVVSGERRSELRDDSKGVTEIRYGSFRRDLVIPDTVTDEDIDATYDRGVLTIRIKGANPAEPAPAKIKIHSADTPKSLTADSTSTDESASDEGSSTA